MSEKKWEVINSEYVITNRWIRIRKDRCRTSRGKIIEEYYVKEGDSSALVFCMARDGSVLFVNQYRHGIGKNTLCLPGGKIEESDTDPSEAIKRELSEETGYSIDKLQFAGRLAKTPANSNEYVYVFFAYCGEKIKEPKFDPGEDIVLTFIPVPELLERILEGEINCTMCVAAIHLVANKYNITAKQNR